MFPHFWVISIFFIDGGTKTFADDSICDDLHCSTMADRFQHIMNFDVHPCDDFYEYACGNYANHVSLPPGWNSMNIRDEVGMAVRKHLISFLKNRDFNDPEAVKKAKWLFESCLDTDALENLGLVPLAILLDKVNFQLRPPFTGKIEKLFSELGKPLARIKRFLDLDFPFSIAVNTDRDDAKWNHLEIRVPKLNANSKIRFSPEKSSTPPSGQQQSENCQQVTPDQKPETTATPRTEEQTETSASKEEKTEDESTTRSNLRQGEDHKEEEEEEINQLPSDDDGIISAVRSSKLNAYSAPQMTKNNPIKRRHSQSARNFKTKKEIVEPNHQRNRNFRSTAWGLVSVKSETLKQFSKDVKQNEASQTVKDEKEALTEFMMKVARAMYRYLNLKVVESKIPELRSKISEFAEIIHGVEKLVASTPQDETKGQKFTVLELQERSLNSEGQPVINWTDFIKTLFSDNDDLIQQYLHGERQIFVENIDYFENVMKFLGSFNARNLYGVLWWGVVRSKLMDTTEEMRKFEDEYRQDVQIATESRENYCLGVVTDIFQYAAAHPYVIDSTIKGVVLKSQEMVSYGIETTTQYLKEQLLPFDMKTIMAAVKKMKAAFLLFGFNAVLQKTDNLNKQYREIVPHKRNFFFSRLLYDYAKTTADLEIISTHNYIEWEDAKFPNPLHTQVTSSSQYNAISVPLSLFQFPYYRHEVKALNFGMQGANIFRELFHLIDTEGSKYSLTGMRERWWKKSSLKQFEEGTKCFVMSYRNILLNEINENVNGESSLIENVADNVAFEIMIRSYDLYLEKNGDKKLVRFETLSHLQLLTIAYAHSMCENESKETLYKRKKGKFAPASARVRGVVMNSPRFATIWKCRPSRPMNPANKCRLQLKPPPRPKREPSMSENPSSQKSLF